MLNQLREKGFEVLALHHAEAILTRDMRGALNELEAILAVFEIPAVELIRGGGGEGQGTQRLRIRSALSPRLPRLCRRCS